MSLHFLHFADLHLGIENYGRLDPGTGLHTRLSDFITALSSVVDLALQGPVDLVIFAGDAYKNCDPTPTHQRELALQLRRLDQSGIPTIMVVGNHDTPTAFGRATSIDIFSALALDNIYVLRRPTLRSIDTRSGPVQIAALPWPTRNILRTHEEYKELSQEELTEKIQAICSAQIDEFARRLTPEIPAILTAHIAAAEAAYSGSERTAVIGQDPVLLTSVLANSAFDYVALGHIHKHQNLHPGQQPPVVYAGSLERIDFGEQEDEKGVCMVSIQKNSTLPKGRYTTYEFIATPARRFVTIEVEVLENQDPTERLVAAIDETDIEAAVVRVLYTLPQAPTAPVNQEKVRQALSPAFYVAAILPQHTPRTHLRRAGIDEELNMREALDRYIDNTPQLQEHRDTLQRYAGAIEQQYASAHTETGDS